MYFCNLNGIYTKLKLHFNDSSIDEQWEGLRNFCVKRIQAATSLAVPKYPWLCPSPAPHLASLHHRELDFYRKYNEQAELQLAGQGDTISKPRATQRRVIGQIISLISLQLTLSPASTVVHSTAPSCPQPHNSGGAGRNMGWPEWMNTPSWGLRKETLLC